MPSPGEKVSPKVTDEEGIDKPIILDWLIISVFQNKKTKSPFIKSDFVFSLKLRQWRSFCFGRRGTDRKENKISLLSLLFIRKPYKIVCAHLVKFTKPYEVINF